MVILGVDPGFINAGFSILHKKANRILLLDSGVLSMKSSESIAYRINRFYDFFNQKILDFGVNAISIETPFLAKNPQNFLKLGYLRGILYLLSSQNNIDILEFSPRQIKLAITGYGAASKDQIARVLIKIFPGFKLPCKFDITDSIAISLCGLWNTCYKNIGKF